MVSDQRFAETRPDVLVYQSPVLEKDITVAGPITPKLFVSTTGTDSDFIVKLIDVYPQKELEERRRRPAGDVAVPQTDLQGWEQLIRGEPFRGKFRHGFEKPEPFTPGKVEEIDFTMPDINHTFRRGHRIMVQVQSSWFPLVDLNPQTFVEIPKARPEDFKRRLNVSITRLGTPGHRGANSAVVPWGQAAETRRLPFTAVPRRCLPQAPDLDAGQKW